MSRVCLICTVPITVTRLGVDACRACAAFFKRTVIAKRKFICRQGGKKCVITKKDKFLCRCCRYDKCMEIGMANALSTKKHFRPPSISSFSDASIFSQELLLDRVESEYKAFCDRRVVLERQYVTIHNLPLYNNISEVILFKNFVRNFYMMECIHNTAKKLKDPSMFMSSLITCMEVGYSKQWTSADSNIVNTDAFQTSLKGFADEYTRLLTPLMIIGELTEREFHALLGLIYCDVATSTHLPDSVLQSLHKTKSRVFDELQNYYRTELKLHDFSRRIGNLMTLTHGAKEVGHLMNEEMQMYSTFFDLYSDDRLFRELIS